MQGIGFLHQGFAQSIQNLVGRQAKDEVHVAIEDDRALSILSIMAEAKEEGAKMVIASATLPNISELAEYLQAEEIIMEDKRNPKITKISIGERPWKGKYYFEEVMPHILEEVKKAIKEDRKIIIFRPSRKQCEWISASLKSEGILAKVHHAGIPFYERKEIENDFKNELLSISNSSFQFLIHRLSSQPTHDTYLVHAVDTTPA